MYHRILMALDGSHASEKEVEYVAEMVSQREDLYFHLAHVLPPSMVAQSDAARDAARDTLERLRQRLCDGGVAPERIDIGTMRSSTDSSLAEALIELARNQECDTIVIGRNSLPWYKELIHQHPADELVRLSEGVAVWVVE